MSEHDTFTLIAWGGVIVTSLGVAIDSAILGARKGLRLEGLADMGPVGWFFLCLLLWIVGFPYYLAKRSEIARRAALVRNWGPWAVFEPGSAARLPWSDGRTYPVRVIEARQGQVHVSFPAGESAWVPWTALF